MCLLYGCVTLILSICYCWPVFDCFSHPSDILVSAAGDANASERASTAYTSALLNEPNRNECAGLCCALGNRSLQPQTASFFFCLFFVPNCVEFMCMQR